MHARPPASDDGARAEPRDVLDTTAAGPRVIRGGVVRVGGYVVGVLTSTVAAAVLLRHLGVTDTGRYAAVVSLIAIAGGLSDLGLTGIGVREFSTRKGTDRNGFMANLLGMRIGYTLAGVAAALLFAVATGYDATMIAGTIVAGIAFLVFLYQGSLSVPLQAQLRLGWVSALQLIGQVGSAIAIVLLSLAGAGLIPLFAAGIPAFAVALVVTAMLVRGDMPVLPAFDLSQWGRTTKLVVSYSVASAMNALYFRVATIMVFSLSDAEQTGYYGASFRIIEALAPVPQLLAAAAFPVIARAALNDSSRLAYALGRMSETMFILGVWAAIAIVLGAQFAIDVVAGPDFQDSVTVLQLQGPAMLGTFLITTWGYGLLAMHRHRELLISNGVALITVLAASLLLIPDHGAQGAAIALTTAELTLATVYGVLLWRLRTGVGVPASMLPRVAFATAVAVGLPVVLDLSSALAVAVATTVFFAALALMRAIPAEIHLAFTSLVHSRRASR